MITSRTTFRREVVREWPIWAGDADIPDTVEVASVEVRRQAAQSVASATASTAMALGTALGRIMDHDQGKLLLVALGPPQHRPSRIAAYNAERDKLWVALEKSGVVLPRGSRAEVEVVHSNDVLQFGGASEFRWTEFSVALEVTRRENAVCVGQIGGPDGFDWGRFFSCLEPLPKDSAELLQASVRRIADGLFVARSFGQFDDAVVGSEIFAENNVIDQLEALIVSAD